MATVNFFQPDEGRHFDGPLDLNEHLIRHPSATFFLRAESGSAPETGVREGDLLVIDRSLPPAPGRLIVVVRSGDLRLERFRRERMEEEETELWGVVTHLIRRA